MEIIQEFNCPHCFSTKVVKNGIKKNGRQNYRCRSCKKQFQHEYLYWGSKIDNKRMTINMLLNGNGIRDIARLLHISTGSIIRTLLSLSAIQLQPSQRYYHQVQVDELYSFVQSKRKKVWILYAYCAQTDEILAVTAGKRNKKTLKDLLKRLQNLTINFWCTDAWRVFKEVFHPQEHLIGKRFTKAIEGVNTSLRNSCKRLHRRTTAFSKKVIHHWIALKLVMNYRNLRTSYI
jgi:IS1 family transposase/transposase-like protein